MNRKSAIALIFALLSAAVISAFILARPYIRLDSVRPLTVKGYAVIPVRADLATLTVSSISTGPNLEEAYRQSEEDFGKLKALVSESLPNSERTEQNIRVDEVMKLTPNGEKTNHVDYFSVTRALQITSEDLDQAVALSQSLSELMLENIRIRIDGPQFVVRNLDPVKQELVATATQNGRERAEIIAQHSGARLGKLMSAKQGPIQITVPNSTNVDSWGIYDTTTIEKDASLVVTLEFSIK